MTTKQAQETDFTRDVLGRYICNGMDEALASTNPNGQRPNGSPQNDARPFDVIVIGGGGFGPVWHNTFLRGQNAQPSDSCARRGASRTHGARAKPTCWDLIRRDRLRLIRVFLARRSGDCPGGPMCAEVFQASPTVSVDDPYFSVGGRRACWTPPTIRKWRGAIAPESPACLPAPVRRVELVDRGSVLPMGPIL